MSSCLSNEGNDCVPWEIHSRETRGTLGRTRQSLPGLQHSPCSGGARTGLLTGTDGHRGHRRGLFADICRAAPNSSAGRMSAAGADSA